MKKIIALLLALTMVLGMAACGAAPAEPTDLPKQTNAPENNDPVESTEAELEPATIQFWILGPGKQKDTDRVVEAFNEMLQEYVPNTTVELSVLTGGEYKEKFNQMLAAGEGVDLCFIAGWVTGNPVDNALNGDLMPLDDLLAEYGQGVVEALSQKVVDVNRLNDGKVYYLANWQGLYTEEHGFKMPTEFAEMAGETWLEDTQAAVTKWFNYSESPDDLQKVLDQFDIYLSTLKENGSLFDKNYHKLLPDGTRSESVSPMYGMNELSILLPYVSHYSHVRRNNANIGISNNDETFTVVDWVNTEDMRVFAKNMAEWNAKGYFREDVASAEIPSTGTSAIWRHDSFGQVAVDKDLANGNSTIKIHVNGRVGTGDSSLMSIPYCADDPERAMMVLNALYTVPELYQLLIYGIEGEHYTDNGDGTITTPYGSQGAEDSDYGLWKWTVGTCKNSLVTQADTAGYYDMMAELEQTGWVSPFGRFVYDTTNTAAIESAIKAIDAEYWPIIRAGLAGDNWENTLNEWIKAREEAGVKDLIADFQNQVDAYIAENNITSWNY